MKDFQIMNPLNPGEAVQKVQVYLKEDIINEWLNIKSNRDKVMKIMLRTKQDADELKKTSQVYSFENQENGFHWTDHVYYHKVYGFIRIADNIPEELY